MVHWRWRHVRSLVMMWSFMKEMAFMVDRAFVIKRSFVMLTDEWLWVGSQLM